MERLLLMEHVLAGQGSICFTERSAGLVYLKVAHARRAVPGCMTLCCSLLFNFAFSPLPTPFPAGTALAACACQWLDGACVGKVRCCPAGLVF